MPWLRNLTDDIFAGNLSVVNRFSENSAWGVDFKYFSLGRIDLTDNSNQHLKEYFNKRIKKNKSTLLINLSVVIV